MKAEGEVKLVMHDGQATILSEALARLNPKAAADVIPAGTPDAMLRVQECVARGGVLGDRVVRPWQAIACPFLGAPAAFPAGTFRLASLLEVPVFLFFGLYLGGNRYEVHMEALAERIVFAAIPVLRAIGLTAALGSLFCLLCAALLARGSDTAAHLS